MFEEIRALADAATPGPWEPGTWYGTDDGGWAAIGPHHVGSEDEHLPHGCEPDCDHHEQAKADARFIAAAREAVPALLAEVERLTSLIRDVEWSAGSGGGACPVCPGNCNRGHAPDCTIFAVTGSIGNSVVWGR